MSSDTLERTVVLDVTLVKDSEGTAELRKKTSVHVSIPETASNFMEGHELCLDFDEDTQAPLKVGVQATVRWDVVAVHLVVFEGDLAVGRTFAWVPLKQTMSLAIADKERKSFLDCYVSYKDGYK